MSGHGWETVFWACAALTAYTYGGYYLILSVLTRLTGARYKADEGHTPSVSVIIAARNEESNIVSRIENLLGQDYPADRLEIIIGSDGSTDGTVAAASGFAQKNVRVLDLQPNRGRAMTHNDCVRAAKGEVMFFSDAETSFAPDFLRKVSRYYADPRVGAVTGGLSFVSRDGNKGAAESVYFRYEKALRKLESDLGLLASGSGACFSVRRSLFRDLRPNEDVDFTLPLECVRSGYRVVMEPEARAFDYPSADVKGVIRSRIRMTSQFQSGFWRSYGLGFVFSHPLTAWALISRKAMRQAVGFFLAGALVSNILLTGTGALYGVLLGAQALFYSAALLAAVLGRAGVRAPGPLSWPLMFVTAHAGMAVGILAGLFGRAPSSYDPEKS